MMAAPAAVGASVGSVKTIPTALSSGSAFRTSSFVQLAQARPAASTVQRVVSTRAGLQESIKRRNFLLGAGAALGFAGPALAANPGSLARQKKVKKPESEAKEKPEAESSATATPSPLPEVSSTPVEPNLPGVSSLPEPLSTTDVPSISEAPNIPEPPSANEVPIPTPEAPAVKEEAPNYDDFNLGDYFKDLFD